jgi:hypothetical protein
VGYEQGDVILAMNGKKIGDIPAFYKFRAVWIQKVEAGDRFKVKVLRKDASGHMHKKTLKARVFATEGALVDKIEFNKAASPDQLGIREAWLKGK